MSYTHHVIARIDASGDTTYLNVNGSWHRHPAEATPFFQEWAVGAALAWVRGNHSYTLTGRLEAMKVSSRIEPLPNPAVAP